MFEKQSVDVLSVTMYRQAVVPCRGRPVFLVRLELSVHGRWRVSGNEAKLWAGTGS